MGTLFLQTRDLVGLLSLCHFSAKRSGVLSYTGLGVLMTGPCTIELSSSPYTSRINVFGSVVSSDGASPLVSVPVVQAFSPSPPQKTKNEKLDAAINSTDNKVDDESTTVKEKDVKSNKRKKSSSEGD